MSESEFWVVAGLMFMAGAVSGSAWLLAASALPIFLCFWEGDNE